MSYAVPETGPWNRPDITQVARAITDNFEEDRRFAVNGSVVMRLRSCGNLVGAVSALSVVLGVVLSGGTGCHKPEPPPVAYTGATLASAALGVDRVPGDPSSFLLMESGPSEGRFPAAIALSRLEPPQDYFAEEYKGGPIRKQWWVGDIAWEERMHWNSLCNTIPQIREMIVMDSKSPVVSETTVPEIVESARRLRASLCLVYGPSPAAPGCAGLWGILLDTRTGDQVAFVQAQAGPEDFQPRQPDRDKRDLRRCDVNYLVYRKLQEQTRQCIMALIARDAAPATTQPSPWRDNDPRLKLYLIPTRATNW